MLDWFVSLRFFPDYLLPALDVLLLFFFIYQGYRLLVQTQAVQLIRGASYIGILYLLAYFLQLQTLLWVLNFLAPSVVIALAIIFQPELRKIFLRIGQGGFFQFTHKDSYPFDPSPVIEASEYLSGKKRGALFVISRRVTQASVADRGIFLNANLNRDILLTIFEHDTRLHDGAIVIENGRIIAAACLLPLSERARQEYSWGTRHRAALGLAEESDAVVVVVSEENGAISLAHDGQLHYDLSPESFKSNLLTLCSSIQIATQQGLK